MDLVKEYSSTDSSEVENYGNSKYESSAEPEIEKNMASKNHAKIQSRLAKILGNHYDENYDIYTEFEIELVGKRVIPDVSIHPLEPSDWKKDVVRGNEAPLLAIEIISPKQAFNEIVDKIYNVYFPAGMKSAWVVLPPVESIMLFQPNQKTKTLNEGILKDTASGFEIDLDKVFK